MTTRAIVSRRLILAILVAFGATQTPPADAALKSGSRAPMFDLQASRGGDTFTFSLKAALAKGPVVVYFYPAAFTPGCTVEAHDFAAAMTKFHALGATVIGVSHDDIDILKRFSVSECRSKFAVAADPDLKVAKAYDAVMSSTSAYASRTSYVVSPDGTIIEEYSSPSPDQHVARTLGAVQRWREHHPVSATRQ